MLRGLGAEAEPADAIAVRFALSSCRAPVALHRAVGRTGRSRRARRRRARRRTSTLWAGAEARGGRDDHPESAAEGVLLRPGFA